jgi:hypothetical protein
VFFFRPTKKPAKRLIYLALLRDSELSRGKKVGVDFGCKSMKNRRLFKTQEYYGVDLDRAALDKGLALYPDAKAIHATIEDAKVPPADFALCINVFGATNFEKSSSLEVVQRLIECIAPDGVLLMTFKRKGERYDIPQHIALLRAAFREVDVMPIALALSQSRLAWLSARRQLNNPTTAENPKRLYCRCVGKL